MNDGILRLEYKRYHNVRTRLKVEKALPTVNVEVESKSAVPAPDTPNNVSLQGNGNEVASGIEPVTAALDFIANDCLELGSDLGLPVSPDDCDAPPPCFLQR